MPIERGDVVVFQDPGGWLAAAAAPTEQNPVVAGRRLACSRSSGSRAPDSNDHLIKRVIGLPGDTVACCNAFGQMTVNGVPLDEPYLKLPPGVTKASGDRLHGRRCPKDSLWVMGDNRYNSKDSRYNSDDAGQGLRADRQRGRAARS